MTETLRNNPGITVICEFIPARIRDADCDPDAALDLLTEMGFKLRAIKFDSSTPEVSREEILAGADWMLFLRRT
jgi:hypothetical protein